MTCPRAVDSDCHCEAVSMIPELGAETDRDEENLQNQSALAALAGIFLSGGETFASANWRC